MAGTLAAKRGKKRGLIVGINVTPMVDVVLVLLVILMVASTYIVAQTLKVHLPKSHATDGRADKPATVTIQKDGALRWNDAEATEEAVISRMKEASLANPDVSLVVSADTDVAHGTVVHVLDIAKGAGITKFAINVQVQ